jgi:hypothetical protein
MRPGPSGSAGFWNLRRNPDWQQPSDTFRRRRLSPVGRLTGTVFCSSFAAPHPRQMAIPPTVRSTSSRNTWIESSLPKPRLVSIGAPVLFVT